MNLIKRFVIKTARILVCITIGTVVGVSLSYGVSEWTAGYYYYTE